ncbi:MAG: undecaprenyl-diphosphatase [Patescibacteria group bacterium]
MDFQLFQIINNLAEKNIWLDSFIMFCAEYLIFVLILIVIYLFFNFRKTNQKYKLFFLASGSAVVSWLVNQWIALFYFRQRPFITHDVIQLVHHSPSKSFPSDHTAVAFALALSIYLLNKKWGVIALIFAFFIAFSRIFCGLHYPLDILSGIITASASILLLRKI